MASLLPEVGADVLLQHAAESRPQVVKPPVKRVDALAQGVTPEGTDLGGETTIAGYHRKGERREALWRTTDSNQYPHE